MNGIDEISSTDFLAVVDGGAKLADVRTEVEKAGLYLAFEPSFAPDDVTIAELVMNGEPGATDGRFGGLREHILSIELVTPGGKIIHTGSRSVKDVGGYEIAGFLLGAGGSCGMISSVTLRLLPSPAERIFFASTGDAGSLRRVAGSIHGRLRPSFLELFESGAAHLIVKDMRSAAPGASLSSETSKASRAVLVGEVQGPGMKNLLQSVMAEEVDAPGLTIVPDRSLLEWRRRFALSSLEELDRGAGVLHISCETKETVVNLSRAVVFRDLHPERIHLVSPLDPGNAGNHDVSGSSSVSGASSAPGVSSEIAGIMPRLCRRGSVPCVEVYEARGGGYGRRRIHRSEFVRIFGDSGASPAAGDTAALEALTARVVEVFDPRRIMLR
jgi:hypothetical protein